MAVIGTRLSAAEPGWHRYEQDDTSITFIKSWSVENIAGADGASGGSDKIFNAMGGEFCFNFTGPQIRLIGCINSDHTAIVHVNIDGETYRYTETGTALIRSALVFEKTGLSDKEHSIRVTILTPTTTTGSVGSTTLDAIDVSAAGVLKPYDPLAPFTKTRIGDLRTPGDNIWIDYTATLGALGAFANMGAPTKNPIPLIGTGTPDGSFRLVFVGYECTGRKKLMADRIIQTQISARALIDAGVYSGKPINIGAFQATLRVPTGNSAMSLGEENDDWLRIICSSDLANRIVPGGNVVWNWANIWSMLDGLFPTSGATCVAGYSATDPANLASIATTDVSGAIGFRPVILLSATSSYVQSKKITPLRVYAPQHANVQVDLEVLDISTDSPKDFQLNVGDTVLSALSSSTSRSIDVTALQEANTITIMSPNAQNDLEVVENIKIIREPKHRTEVSRTFTAVEGGYALNGVTYNGYATPSDEAVKPTLTNIGAYGDGLLYKLTVNPNVTKVEVI